MAPVLLFDIDGTLIRSGGAGKAAVEAALTSRFGITDIRDGIPFSGRTDHAILGDILRLHDLEPSHDNIVAFVEAYLDHLPTHMQRLQGTHCPGVVELLPKLTHRPLGLLTGNVERGARHKLAHFGLDHYFRFGGFGGSHTNRDDVARSALAAIRQNVGPVKSENIWVIGDTPLDVQCARAIGAKAVAVATGWNTIDELHATGADLVLENLVDHSRLPREWFHV
jgi:phosphoglycolate phosphatase-like HAD superfamily hydrolase